MSQDLFEQLDSDHSGTLTLIELSVGLRRQGYVLSDGEAQQLLRGVDLDHDGSVVLSEFMTTLIDWNLMQASQEWQVRCCLPGGAEGGRG